MNVRFYLSYDKYFEISFNFLMNNQSLINSIIQEHYKPALNAAINDSDTAGMSLPARDKMQGLLSI